MPSAILYAVDLEELRQWVGRADPEALEEARRALRESEDYDWEAEEAEIVDRLFGRLVMQGELYAGLNEEERYYLTQLLIDLFDEFVEAEPVSDEIPLEQLEAALEPLRRRREEAPVATWLTRGRELGGAAPLLPADADPEDLLPYLGYVARDELPTLTAALERGAGAPPARRRRGGGAAKTLLAAARLCAETERDLLVFVG